ncbi:MAG: CAP domain-containing protein [Sulfurovum sp.]|nr:CAP domain-containing protein [Sulfurovum sp.]
MKKIAFYSLICFTLIGCGGVDEFDTLRTNHIPNAEASSNDTKTFDVPDIESSVKQGYLEAINNARAKQQNCGKEGIKKAVNSLVWSDELYAAAYEHSEDLAESNTFSHDGSGTSSDWTAEVKNLGRESILKERIENNGYSSWKTIGENITGGTNQDLAQEAVDAWLKSDGHCANLMNPAYKDVGMAHVEKEGTRYTHYWTQNFGAK